MKALYQGEGQTSSILHLAKKTLELCKASALSFACCFFLSLSCFILFAVFSKKNHLYFCLFLFCDGFYMTQTASYFCASLIAYSNLPSLDNDTFLSQ